MRTLLSIILIFSFGRVAWADDAAGAIFLAGLIGGSVNVAHQSVMGRLPEELNDWMDPKTQSTSRLQNQCGVLSELKLLRSSQTNFIFLGVRNEGANDVTLQLDRVRMKFSSGKERFVTVYQDKRVQEVKKDWYTWGLLAIPSKSDFKDQKNLEVTVPVITGSSTCELKATFNRNPEVDESLDSVISAPAFLMSFGYGTSLSTSGRLKELAEGPGTGLDLYLAGFQQPTNGWYLDLGLFRFKDVKDTSFFSDPYREGIQATDISIGKVYRFFNSEQMSSYLNIGPLLTSFNSYDGLGKENNNSKAKSYGGIYAAYAVDWKYFSIASPAAVGVVDSFNVGLTFFLKYYPYMTSEAPKDSAVFGFTFDFLRGGN